MTGMEKEQAPAWPRVVLGGFLVVGLAVGASSAILSRRASRALAEAEVQGSAPSASGLLQRALIHVRRGQVELAQRELDMALGLAPGPVQAVGILRTRAELRAQRGDEQGALADLDLALERSPGDVPCLTARAQLHLGRGSFLLAETDCSAAIERSPDHALAHRLLGRARLEDGRARQALSDLARAVELAPQDAVAYAYRSAAYLRLKQRNAAEDDAERAITLNPDLELAHRNLGIVLTERGATAQALKALGRALELERTAEGYAARAAARLQARDWKGAIEDADQALRRQPNLLEAQAVRREARRKEDELREQAALGEPPANPADPRRPPTIPAPTPEAGTLASFSAQGRAHLVRRDFPAAQAAYGQALRLDPNHPPSLLGRAAAWLGMNRLQEALQDLDLYLKLVPGDPQAHRIRGLIRYRMQDDLGAARDLQIAVRADPNDPQVCGTLGLTLVRLGDHPQAIKALSRAIELAPGSPMATPYVVARGESRMRVGDRAGAARDLDLGVQRFPRDPGVLHVRARLHLMEGEFEEAIDVFSRILVVNSGDVSALSNKGFAETMLERFTDAVDSCSRAIALDPRNSGAFTNRARARLRSGDPTGAAGDCETALRLLAANDSRRSVVEKLLEEAKRARGGD